MFGKKSKNSETETVASAAKTSNGELAKVLDESVWESVFEDLKANKHFIIKDGNSTKYIAFLLDTMQFGGLAGKEAKKDESKGSIVEAIKTGRIKTYLRTEMLFDNCIVIIPDRDTIENMDEFNLFNKAEYIPCTIDSGGVIITVTERGTMDADDPERVVNFNLIKDLVRNEGDVNVLFSASVPDSVFGSDAEEDVPEDPEDFDTAVKSAPAEVPVDSITRPEESIPEEEPMDYESLDGDYGDADDLDYDGLDEEVNADVNTSGADMSGILEESDPGDYIDENTGGYDEYEDIGEDIVSDFVVRTMYSQDLGLEISTQPFDMQFMHLNAFVPFNENRGEGWLNEQLSNYSKDANSHMERLHSEHLFQLREKYMRLIQEQCSSIVKLLDISDPATHYGSVRQLVEENLERNLGRADELVAGKRNQLEEAWQRQLDLVAEAAANEARKDHISRYGKTHEKDLQDLKIKEEDSIRADYRESLSRLNDDRRAEASKLLDIAINNILEILSKSYAVMVEAENVEYNKYQEWMSKFIDENRKDERARIEALAEENRQVMKANEVRGEYIAKIKAMTAEFDMKKTVLQADLDRIRKEHSEEMRTYGQELTSKLEIEREHSASLQKQLDELFERYKNLEDRKNAECDERIRTLKEDSDTKDEQMRILSSASARSNRMTMLFAGAVAVVALVVGILIGGSGKTDAPAGGSANTAAISYRVIHEDTGEESFEEISANDAANSIA